jgi:hypothetical protein
MGFLLGIITTLLIIGAAFVLIGILNGINPFKEFKALYKEERAKRDNQRDNKTERMNDILNDLKGEFQNFKTKKRIPKEKVDAEFNNVISEFYNEINVAKNYDLKIYGDVIIYNFYFSQNYKRFTLSNGSIEVVFTERKQREFNSSILKRDLVKSSYDQLVEVIKDLRNRIYQNKRQSTNNNSKYNSNNQKNTKQNMGRFTYDYERRKNDKRYDRYITLKENYVLRWDALQKIKKEKGSTSDDYNAAKNEINVVARKIKKMKQQYNYD